MEKQVKIRTPDKKYIYGILNWKRKTEKLVIFVHGLTGSLNEHQFFNAAQFFPGKGFATLRFNLYCGEKGARQFTDTALSMHSEDLDTVVSHFSKKYGKIYLVGHSLGGPTILLSKMEHAKAVVLWDPSENIKQGIGAWCTYERRLNVYIIDWGIKTTMSKKYYDELVRLPSMTRTAKDVRTPLKIITAGKGVLEGRWKGFKNKVVIKGASHGFDEEGVEEKLFDETLNWIKKF